MQLSVGKKYNDNLYDMSVLQRNQPVPLPQNTQTTHISSMESPLHLISVIGFLKILDLPQEA